MAGLQQRQAKGPNHTRTWLSDALLNFPIKYGCERPTCNVPLIAMSIRGSKALRHMPDKNAGVTTIVFFKPSRPYNVFRKTKEPTSVVFLLGQRLGSTPLAAKAYNNFKGVPMALRGTLQTISLGRISCKTCECQPRRIPNLSSPQPRSGNESRLPSKLLKALRANAVGYTLVPLSQASFLDLTPRTPR